MNLTKITQLSLVILTLTTSQALAATSGTLNLQGSVSPDFQITVTSNGNNSSLPILTGASALTVASVLEYSNSNSGYKIQASSANNGSLKNGSVDSVAYTVSYGSGSPISLSSSAQTLYTSSSLSSPTSNTQGLKVSFNGKATALAGDYTDTITLTISTP